MGLLLVRYQVGDKPPAEVFYHYISSFAEG